MAGLLHQLHYITPPRPYLVQPGARDVAGYTHLYLRVYRLAHKVAHTGGCRTMAYRQLVRLAKDRAGQRLVPGTPPSGARVAGACWAGALRGPFVQRADLLAWGDRIVQAGRRGRLDRLHASIQALTERCLDPGCGGGGLHRHPAGWLGAAATG